MTRLQLPESFLAMMRKLLGEEYEAFIRGFDGRRQFGLRVNTAKIELEEFERIAPFHLSKIPWIPEGYFYEEEDAPARHPFYAAGLYYLQEPSAMSPASRLPVQPGERVLDLCAAPGGKATALGAKLKGEGLLVANDINTARAKALLRNLELFGISNTFVVNEPPHILAERYPEYFDKIMVDAPCSGEGMFRKNPAVVEAWLEKGPEYFSKLQKEIVLHAADMLRPGGQMLYSTCTFSPAENESVITHLLRERPALELIPMEDYEGFSGGITSFEGEVFHEDCRLCRRIFPHRMAGEGHFMALLRKKGESNGDTSSRQPTDSPGMFALQEDGQSDIQEGVADKKRKKDKKNKKKSPRRNERQQSWWSVCDGLDSQQRQALEEFFVHVKKTFRADCIDVRGDRIYYVPEQSPANGTGDGRKGLHFLRNGLYMGDLKKKRFEPSQPFALALTREDFDNCLDFAGEDENLQRYLRGESLILEEEDDGGESNGGGKSNGGEKSNGGGKKNATHAKGWYLVLADGHPLGFGKLVGTILKNKYPAGWRR